MPPIRSARSAMEPSRCSNAILLSRCRIVSGVVSRSARQKNEASSYLARSTASFPALTTSWSQDPLATATKCGIRLPAASRTGR